RRTLVLPSAVLAGVGLVVAVIATLPAGLVELPFFTGLWLKLDLGDGAILPLSTPLLFDIGVFLVVIGGVCAILLALEEDPETDQAGEP
ncbi:MAG: MnhB domain-containing protein, partial [Elioraea tepidiphila]